jgi:hypothetical protein
MRTPVVFCALVVAGALACGGTSGQQIAKAQEAMVDLNAHSRFGRMEVAAEHVKPSEREGFLKRRTGWGSTVQIADSEIVGLQVGQGAKDEAVAYVRLSWYRVADGELRSTTVMQKWKVEGVRGDWYLIGEERIGGDAGLLGERVDVLTPDTPRVHAQFPTVRIGAQDE